MSTGLREIKVFLEISYDPPVGESCVHPALVPGRSGPTPSPDSDSVGPSVYLYVSVQDSGPGLQKDDLALLFQR